jgi:hypothetical protein
LMTTARMCVNNPTISKLDSQYSMVSIIHVKSLATSCSVRFL